MKSRLLQFVLILVCTLGAGPYHAQDLMGAKPKKARTPDDYKPRTLKETAADPDAESRRDAEDKVILHGDLLPSLVRVTYKGSARPLPQIKKEVLRRWAMRYAGAPEHYTVPYGTELLFNEAGVKYWLAVRKESIAQFKKEFKKGATLDLYLIRLGWAGTGDKWEPLLLVESFRKAK